MRVVLTDALGWFLRGHGVVPVTLGAIVGVLLDYPDTWVDWVVLLGMTASALLLLRFATRWLTGGLLRYDRNLAKVSRKLYRFLGRHREGDALVLREERIAFMVNRTGTRGLDRFQLADADLPQVGAEHGVIPFERFAVLGNGMVVRWLFAWSVKLDEDGELGWVKSANIEKKTIVRERLRAIRLAQRLGMATPTVAELEELVEQLQRAEPVDEQRD